MTCYLGIDVGTSGVRGTLIDDRSQPIAESTVKLPAAAREADGIRQDARLWWAAMCEMLHGLDGADRAVAVAIDGTSGTVLPCDSEHRPLARARMYNDQHGEAAAARIDAIAPAASVARGAGSTLARMLNLLDECAANGDAPAHVQHQADWLTGRLAGRTGLSDANNCLKLGYDVVNSEWPPWMRQLGFATSLLPTVCAPGTPIGPLAAEVVADTGLSPGCLVVSGTTDGNAAFGAAGDFAPGVAVTSLGTTLTVKLLSQTPVFAPDNGVYSHRFMGHWLAGGASNTGGAALLQFFDVDQLTRLSHDIDPERSSGLDYYPLPARGERFPVADPNMASRTDPRPASDSAFLHGLLEGIARVERDAYTRLAELGATPVREVRTAGGGAGNGTWTRLRARLLGVPVRPADYVDAAYGTARLARAGHRAGTPRS